MLLAGAARRRAISPHPPLNLDLHRSFAVTDQAILDGFAFERVMKAIVERSGTHTTALRLYQQMFDTQNPRPGRVVADAPHCDDAVFNGLPRRCPTAEGALATTDPFAAREYIPLALLNRFDLTPVDGSNCGQYRIIFAKKTLVPLDRVHLIFEAVLPNPAPSSGLAGCRAVAEFWAGLTRIDSIFQRRAELEKFFFTGIAGFEPVVDPSHYSLASGGSIRSLHSSLLTAQLYRFYQFRLVSRGGALIAEPDALENNPWGRFFDGSNDSPAARAFREEFIRHVATLAIRDVNLYFMNVPREFLLTEADPISGEVDFAFLRGLATADGQEFSRRIAAELTRIGSTLTPRDIVARAYTQSCVGCHFSSRSVGESVVFPRSIEPFQHVSEQFVETGEAGPRFSISPAMRDVFIPHRMEILRRFLTSDIPPVHSNGTLGGERTVQ
jgi:hypothetical protein